MGDNDGLYLVVGGRKGEKWMDSERMGYVFCIIRNISCWKYRFGDSWYKRGDRFYGSRPDHIQHVEKNKGDLGQKL